MGFKLGMESEEKEALIDSYFRKNEEVKATVCLGTFLDYLDVNGYINAKKVRKDFRHEIAELEIMGTRLKHLLLD